MSEQCELTWELKAQIAEFLAFSLRYPEQQLACAVASGEWAQTAREVAAVLGMDVPEGFAEDAARLKDGSEPEGADALMHALRAEATRLFIAAAPKPAVSPYESVQRSKDGEALLFVDEHALAAERFMKSCGVVNRDKAGMPSDHVAAELEFLEYLAAVQAGIVQVPEGGVEPAAMPGGSAGAAYRTFVRDHALIWFGKFARELEAETRLPFYRAVARILGAYAEEIG